MAQFDFTPEDVARGTILAPGWYTLEVTKVEDGVTKTKGEQRSLVSLKVLDGKDHEGNDAPGVLVFAQFMPAYPGFAVKFCNALGAGIGKEGKAGIQIDDNLVGQRLQGYVKNKTYEDRMQNTVEDYRPLDS